MRESRERCMWHHRLSLLNGLSDYVENVAATRCCGRIEPLSFAVYTVYPLKMHSSQCLQPSTTLLHTPCDCTFCGSPHYTLTLPHPRAPHHGTFRRCSTRCVGASSFCCAASSYTATQQARLRSRVRYSRSEAPPGTIWPPRALSAAARHRPRPRRRPSGSRPVTWSPPFDRGQGLQRREVESLRRTGRDPTSFNNPVPEIFSDRGDTSRIFIHKCLLSCDLNKFSYFSGKKTPL